MKDIKDYIEWTFLKNSSKEEVIGFFEIAKKQKFHTLAIPAKWVDAAKVWNFSVIACIGFDLKKITEKDYINLVNSTPNIIERYLPAKMISSIDQKILRKECWLAHTKGIRYRLVTECSELTEEQFPLLVQLLINIGANSLSTSAGFSIPAEPELVQKLVNILPKRIEVKAASGINDLQKAQSLLDAGAKKIGTSKILE
jgi:deoxyribose-phosphate aldolase